MTNRRRTGVALAAVGLLAACARVTPVPGLPQGIERGPVFVDETELLLRETHPVQVGLVVRGSLPTPCHQAHWEVEEADVQGRIDVALYSTAPEGQACIQVLAEFEETIPLGSYAEGSFSVWLNGAPVQSFRLP